MANCRHCDQQLESSWTGDFLYCVNLSCPLSGDEGIVWKRRFIPKKDRDEDSDEEDDGYRRRDR